MFNLSKVFALLLLSLAVGCVRTHEPPRDPIEAATRMAQFLDRPSLGLDVVEDSQAIRAWEERYFQGHALALLRDPVAMERVAGQLPRLLPGENFVATNQRFIWPVHESPSPEPVLVAYDGNRCLLTRGLGRYGPCRISHSHSRVELGVRGRSGTRSFGSADVYCRDATFVLRAPDAEATGSKRCWVFDFRLY